MVRSGSGCWVRLKELDKENDRLKRLVAELSLDNRMLKDIVEGKV